MDGANAADGSPSSKRSLASEASSRVASGVVSHALFEPLTTRISGYFLLRSRSPANIFAILQWPKGVVDAVTRKRGPQQQERARNGVCVRVD
ncbi:hypothetical protein [Scleromatobacter humisilvae]|uniref:Uncharacterized protein n=1 Tax=Scleromatobacter humisilvae TaxID=2897159 RepID=A0A9X1YH51_9BURK|nr:hypothetical protein [Scleromatobacter humisilvae]MCK9684322.1 hypothetical protein [Scleromatobacter humisilvae]